MGDKFVDKSEAFFEWFTSHRSTSINSKIALHDYRSKGAGRGVIAVEDIEEDELLFSIPRESILTTASSDLSSLVSGLPADPWLKLILVLMFEYLQGARSRWKAYLDVLPTDADFNTLMFWTDAELDHLQASAVRDKIGKASADDTFRVHVLPFVEQHSAVFYPAGGPALSSAELLALAHRMGSAIMAYGFDLEPVDEARQLDDEGFASDDDDEVLPKGMLPMADMLNADVDSNARLTHGVHDLSMVSLRPIRRGEEVLNDYGPLPRSDLLRRYGYITDKYAKYDVVEIPHDLVMKHVKASASNDTSEDDLAQRIEFLDEIEVLDQGYDIERGDMASPDAANRVHIPDELLHLMKILLVRGASYRKLHKLSDEQLVPLMESVGRVSHDILEERLSQYPTSTEADKATLTDPGLSLRERMAVQVRLGEKTLLEDAIALARSWKEVGGASAEGAISEPPSKRHRAT